MHDEETPNGVDSGTDTVDPASTVDPATRTHADYCRPFHMEGPLVEVVRQQLRERAKALGWHLRPDEDLGGLHLLVDGARVEPVRQGFSVSFQLPEGAGDVWLVSRSGRPCDVEEGNADMRVLGVCVIAITVIDGFKATRVPADDPRLDEGYNHVERDGAEVWRWTSGRARLPADLLAECVGPRLMRIDLAGAALPSWVCKDETAD